MHNIVKIWLNNLIYIVMNVIYHIKNILKKKANLKMPLTDDRKMSEFWYNLYITYKYANSDKHYVYNNLVLIFENSI